MRITLRDPLVRSTINERSSFNVVAQFWDDSTDSWAADAPTTVHYRIDDAYAGQVRNWTSIAASTSVIVPVDSSDTQIYDDTKDIERRTLTIKADSGLSTQYQDSWVFYVRNLGGQT